MKLIQMKSVWIRYLYLIKTQNKTKQNKTKQNKTK